MSASTSKPSLLFLISSILPTGTLLTLLCGRLHRESGWGILIWIIVARLPAKAKWPSRAQPHHDAPAAVRRNSRISCLATAALIINFAQSTLPDDRNHRSAGSTVESALSLVMTSPSTG